VCGLFSIEFACAVGKVSPRIFATRKIETGAAHSCACLMKPSISCGIDEQAASSWWENPRAGGKLFPSVCRRAKGMTAGHVRTQKSINLISARCVNKGLRRTWESIKLHRDFHIHIQIHILSNNRIRNRMCMEGVNFDKDSGERTWTRTRTTGKSHQSRKV